MNRSAPFLQELAMEAATTRRVLERVPESKLVWRPHERSMSLGQLALHVAAGDPPSAASHGALMAAFDESVTHAQRHLESLSDARAMAMWTLKHGEMPLFSAPRVGMIRSFLFNHWYHHRGQLVVYLRLLDVPVPSVYGPTADENPFTASH
jgi:uncharacterized damage-inducible protein DinB